MQTRGFAILVAQFSFTRGELQAESNGRARLVNISGRLQVQGDEDVVIAGFIITGNTPRKILVRRLGPVPDNIRSLRRCACGFGQRFDIGNLTAWSAISGNKIVTKSDFRFSVQALFK